MCMGDAARVEVCVASQMLVERVRSCARRNVASRRGTGGVCSLTGRITVVRDGREVMHLGKSQVDAVRKMVPLFGTRNAEWTVSSAVEASYSALKAADTWVVMQMPLCNG